MRDSNRPSTIALVYLLGMVGTTLCGTAFVVGGMLAGARGLTAVSLAAIVPLAGLLWAIVLSTIDREQQGRARRVTGYQAVRDGLVDANEHRHDRPLGPGNDPVGPLVGPGQNHW